MSAILSPASDVAIERVDTTDVFRLTMDYCDESAAHGNHLAAVAGRARLGALLASLAADDARSVYADAAREWEASHDSSTRGALNRAAVDAGYNCESCGMLSAACECAYLDRLAALFSGMR